MKDIEKTIASMNLLKDRIDASAFEGEMMDAVESLNDALDRIASVIEESKECEQDEGRDAQ